MDTFLWNSWAPALTCTHNQHTDINLCILLICVRMAPWDHIFECLVCTLWNCLRMIRKRGLVGGCNTYLSRFQNSMPFPVSSPLLPLSALCLWIRLKLSATAPTPCFSACCHVFCLNGHDSNLLQLWVPKFNAYIYAFMVFFLFVFVCFYHGNREITKIPPIEC